VKQWGQTENQVVRGWSEKNVILKELGKKTHDD